MMPPADTLDKLRRLYGDVGAQWIAALPSLIEACAARWSLDLGAPMEVAAFSALYPARHPDGPRVLKLTVPNPELVSEAAALRWMADRGAVGLIDADLDRGALLLERVEPGTTLYEAVASDDAATRIAARAMARLHAPAPQAHPFPTLEGWGRGFARIRALYGGTSGPIPADLFEEAERRFAELVATSPEPALLHGDLHPWNLLAGPEGAWIVIDPKGVVGDPAAEAACWLRNPMPELLGRPDLERRLARRLDILADESGLDRDRMLGWGAALALLSACWNLEDFGEGWAEATALARAIGQGRGS